MNKGLGFLFVISLFGASLASCSKSEPLPTSLKASKAEEKLIVGSVRDLNDIVTLRFEPKGIEKREVVWSMPTNDVCSLEGSIITANKLGIAYVKATSVYDSGLSTVLRIRVYDPTLAYHHVVASAPDGCRVDGLEGSYQAGEEVSFNVVLLNQDKMLNSVKMNGSFLYSNDSKYTFTMPDEDVLLSIELLDIVKATSASISDEEVELAKGKTALLTASALPINTTDKPVWSIVEGESIVSLTPDGDNATISALEPGFAKIKVAYNDSAFDFCTVHVLEKPVQPTGLLATYKVAYDLGTRKTSKLLESEGEIVSSLVLEDGEDEVESLSEFSYIYGGAYGKGTSGNWYFGDVIKFGTTSANGILAFNLEHDVNEVKITGYVADASAKIRVGDASSADWEGGNDGKTALHTCADMKVIDESCASLYQATTITLDFDKTSELKIGTTNKKPLYITEISFIYEEVGA